MSFLMVGAGVHTVQTAGLALATDLAPPEDHPKIVGLMYVMLLLGSVLSGVVFGVLLQDFSPAKLVQVIQAAAVTTLVLNTIALWKQETRRPPRGAVLPERPRFGAAWASYIATPGAQRRLVAIGLGTMAFSMQDVLLEPYGGQVLGMSVSGTTWLTAALAAGGLTGFGLASRILGRGADPARLSMAGACIGLPAFGAVLMASVSLSVPLFAFGAALIGLGAGIFSHGTLTVTMNRAPKEQIGLALGVWGAVQATCAGIAVALGGVLRDVVGALAANGVFGPALNVPATGYAFVYLVEVVLLLATIVVMGTLVRPRPGRPVMQTARSWQQ
jgi:BCD family chlorophyll transporter-like MFS transporter